MMNGNSSEQNYIQSMSGIFSQLGRPWTISLILALGERGSTNKLHELQDKIRKMSSRKIPENALLKCIEDLSQLGLVTRVVHEESPTVEEYGLTNAGNEMYRHMIRMTLWDLDGSSNGHTTYSDISAC
jgi:DNA-binding HxlR family transcriptional regulator